MVATYREWGKERQDESYKTVVRLSETNNRNLNRQIYNNIAWTRFCMDTKTIVRWSGSWIFHLKLYYAGLASKLPSLLLLVVPPTSKVLVVSSLSIDRVSTTSQCFIIFPLEIRYRTTPLKVVRLSVAGMPWNSPFCVPYHVAKTTTLSSSAIIWSIVQCKSGNAER